MIEWENGELSDEDTIKLFQSLVDSGLVWQLQGSYGRQAVSMLEEGLIHPPRKKIAESQRDYYGNPNPAGRHYRKGWISESARHALARKGIKTGRKK